MANKSRWQYRFDNYKRAYGLLKSAVEKKQEQGLSELETEGVIQRFEYTIELAWKTMKDYLEGQNVVFEQITPRAIIRQAFISKLITDGATWQEALDARNKMSHTYDIKVFEAVISDIQNKYIHCLAQLHDALVNYQNKP